MTRPTDERLRRVADGMQADHDEQQAMAAELLALRAEAAEREARAFWRGVTACEAQRADDEAKDFADAFLHHEYYGNDRQADDAIDSSERAHDTATRLRAALASDAGSRWADDPRGTCPDCGHGWAYHASPSSGGPCGVTGCDCEGEERGR